MRAPVRVFCTLVAVPIAPSKHFSMINGDNFVIDMSLSHDSITKTLSNRLLLVVSGDKVLSNILFLVCGEEVEAIRLNKVIHHPACSPTIITEPKGIDRVRGRAQRICYQT